MLLFLTAKYCIREKKLRLIVTTQAKPPYPGFITTLPIKSFSFGWFGLNNFWDEVWYIYR